MAYDNNSLTTVRQLKDSAEKAKAEANVLRLAQSVLDARMDAQVTASTDIDADYAAEVVDGRVDMWANEQASLGANIRNGQSVVMNALTLGISAEEEYRTSDDDSLQRQINSLSEAVLGILATISENRERLGGIS